MLRSARPEDADAIASVLAESRRVFLPFAASAHSDRETRDWVRSVLIHSGGVTVYEREGAVVAVLATSADTDASWIDQLYVLPGHTARGIGAFCFSTRTDH